jgi:acyl-coenzyme A thioesterase PaaI-like protein
VLVDAAAAHAVGEHATTADVVLHFLRPGRVGPAVARASVIAARPDGHVVRVEVVDAGAHDRVMAVAVSTVRRF